MIACKPISATVFGPTSLLNKGIALLLEQSGYGIDCEDTFMNNGALPDDIDKKSLKVILGDDGPDFSSADTISKLRISYPSSLIVVLYRPDVASDVDAYLNLGADGCLPLTIGPEGLVSALNLIVSEKIQLLVHGWRRAAVSVDKKEYSDSARLNSVPRTRDLSASAITTRMADSVGISEREHAVLENLIRGDSNKVIARRLSISEATVKIHVRSLLRKIGAENRTQAAIWVLNEGVTDPSTLAISKNYQ